MKIISDQKFINCLKEIAYEYGYELNDGVCKNLEKYKNILIEWNKSINLTGITDNYGIILKHFIDCLECTKYINDKCKVIDIGTGAGFPGMVMAIFFEDKLDITLMDSLGKRINFLNEVKSSLGFKNVSIVQARAEDNAHDKIYREKYDIVCARAVAPLNHLIEYTSAYLKIGGKCLFMKGDKYLEEINESKKCLSKLNCKINNIYNYNLKSDTEIYNRVIVEILKINDTPDLYPRSYSKIKKNPL